MSQLQQVGRNLLTLSTTQLLSRVFSFIATAHIARVLDVHLFGAIVAALAILVYAELLVDFGLTRFCGREVARDNRKAIALMPTVLSLRLLLAIIASGLLLLFIWLWPGPTLSKQITLLYGIAVFIVVFDMRWVILGLESMRILAVAEIVSQCLFALLVLFLVRNAEQVFFVPLAYLLGRVVYHAIMVAWYRSSFAKLSFTRHWQDCWKLARSSTFIALTLLVSIVNFNFDILALSAMKGQAAAGLYGAAYYVVLLPSLLVTAYLLALRPSLDRTQQQSPGSAKQLLEQSLQFSVVSALALGVAGVLLAESGFALIFSPAYSDAVPAFQILIWTVSLMLINRHYREILIAFDYRRQALGMTVIAVIINIFLNLLLIPYFGLIGAAFATVVAETVFLLLGYYWVQRLVIAASLWRFFPKSIVAAGLLAMVIVSMTAMGLVVQMIAALLAFPITLLLVKIYTPAEMRALLRIFSRQKADV